MTILDQILESYSEDEFIKADGHDNAIIGVDEKTMRLVYSRTKVIAGLVAMEMTYEEAVEFYDFNIEGAYIEGGPIFVNDDWEDPVKQ